MIITDNETKVDLLNNEAIAKTIVGLLRGHPDQPVTIGVHGDWGAGKSSILEMVEDQLGRDEKVLCIKFNGWRFQGFEDAKIALIEGIVTALVERRPLLAQAGDAVKDIFKRIDYLKLARKAGGFAVTALTGIPTPEVISTAVEGMRHILSDPASLATAENLEKARGVVDGLLKPAETRNVPREIQEFRKAFDELLGRAGIEQLIVLVDDLDRCLPDTAIETLEAIRLFVFTSRTAFIVAADEAMIEYAVRRHFPELPDTTGPRDYARNYLEKLIQVPFRIPALGETETRIYVTLLLIGERLGDTAGYARLIARAGEILRRPWATGGLDAALVRDALSNEFEKAQDALTLSDQIGPTLATGTQGNPRQIKRFLNTLLLRHALAEARGFGGEVKLPVLGKLMLAERFIPKFFDQVAGAAARNREGKCVELKQLEADAAAAVTEAGSPPQRAPRVGPRVRSTDAAPSPPAAADDENLLLTEWKAAEVIRSWARVAPALGDVDLRPYLFVAKDRKDYFGAASALGRLASVVEKLLGSKLQVQAIEQDLKQLVAAEANQVFEELRGRIMGGDSFDRPPPGIDGLMVLVRAHPALQSDLLELLGALPADRCGAWVAGGWEGVIKGPENTKRLEHLLTKWSESKNPMLKQTAAGALRIRRGGR